MYPHGTYVPIGINDRSEREQKALDEEMRREEEEGFDFSDNEAILARLGLKEESKDQWQRKSMR